MMSGQIKTSQTADSPKAVFATLQKFETAWHSILCYLIPQNKTPKANTPFSMNILVANPRENFGLFSYFYVGNLTIYIKKKWVNNPPSFFKWSRNFRQKLFYFAR